jgi:hypothetical protein
MARCGIDCQRLIKRITMARCRVGRKRLIERVP